jgi:hypothetical protein
MRTDAPHRSGHEAYRRGTGHGGRYIPAEAIHVLAGVPFRPADPPAEIATDELPEPDSTVTELRP